MQRVMIPLTQPAQQELLTHSDLNVVLAGRRGRCPRSRPGPCASGADGRRPGSTARGREDVIPHRDLAVRFGHAVL